MNKQIPMDIRKHMRDVDGEEDINKSLFVVMFDLKFLNNGIEMGRD